MENIDFATLINTFIEYIVSIGKQVNDLPGGLAFALGLVTWFLVEQALRRILSWVRWLILIGAIVGLGYTLPLILNELIDRGALPFFGEEELMAEPAEPSLSVELTGQ